MKNTHRPLFSRLSLAALLACAPLAQAEVVTFMPGMLLGAGYDSISGTVKQDCVNAQADSTPGASALQSVSYAMAEITSNADLLSMTGVDASASVQASLFSASAEMSMLSQNKVSNYDANMLAEVSVEKGWRYARNAALKTDRHKQAQDNPLGFRQDCGDRYVAGVLYGGRFYGLVTVSTSSQAERLEVSTAISASYRPYAVQGALSTETVNTLNKYQGQTRVQGYIGGGQGSAALPLTLDTMRARMSHFPNEIQSGGGTPIQVMLAEYPNMSSSGSPAIQQLAMLRWDYVSVLAEIDYILREPGQFYMDFGTWRAFLQRTRSETSNAITAVDSALQRCRSGSGTCGVPTNLRQPGTIRADLPPRYSARCGNVNLALPNLDVQNLSGKCGGDDEMDGNNPSINVSTSLVPAQNGNILNTHTRVQIKEGKKDWTCFTGTQDKTVLAISTAYPGCYWGAKSSATLKEGLLNANAGNDNHDWTTFGNGTGLIKSANCLSDTKGKDRGKLGCKNIDLNATIITLAHDEDRQGLNQLRNSALISQQTVSASQRQVDRIAVLRNARAQAAAVAFKKETGIAIKLQPAMTNPPRALPPTFKVPATGQKPAPR